MRIPKMIHQLYYVLVYLVATGWLGVQSVSADTEVDSFQFKNPTIAGSIPDFLYAVLRIFVISAVPIVIFFIIYAGFLYVTARGNAEQLKTAHTALLYAIVGGLIVVGATVIVGIVTNLVDAFLS